MNLKEIIDLASDQFKVKNAEISIAAASELEDVFSPPHHGPQNVPIWVETVDHGDNFTHYPIVNSCKSYIFLPHEADEVELFDFHYNGPSQKDPSYFPIELAKIDRSKLRGSGFKQGFETNSTVIFNQGDPQPIAIHFSVRAEEDAFVLKYIVVSVDAKA
ncbi:MAG: hypothetical protein AAGN35_10905 [Bacteroidota bacterium]